MKLYKSKGRGNSKGLSSVDMNVRHWVILNHCTCDDDPYANACQFCLCERGNKIGYTDEEVLKVINSN